jgi:ribosome recycling factor
MAPPNHARSWRNLPGRKARRARKAARPKSRRTLAAARRKSWPGLWKWYGAVAGLASVHQHPNPALQAKDKLKSVSERLDGKLMSLRAGGADAAILEVLTVETGGGQRVALKNLGTVAVSSPRLMVVHVHDAQHVMDVEKAVMASGLNLMPRADKAKSLVEVPVPKTTTEQREARIKLASEMTEAAKLELRRMRQDVQKKLKGAGLPKDDLERAEKQLQKVIDAGNDKLAGQFDKKKKDLTSA